MAKNTIRIGKLDAARRQLRTAISLWFNEGDPVAIHSLAFAAYEILHFISEKRDPNRRDLLFDTALVKDEYRRDWNQRVRRDANFFKHADRDGDSVIDFDPVSTEMFILFAITGRELCGEQASDEEQAFNWWLHIHRTDRLTERGKKVVADTFPVDALAQLRTVSKSEFFEAFLQARIIASRSRALPHPLA